MKTDISNRNDIKMLVESFYSKALKDEVLKPFFVNLNFETHLPKMIDFWSLILLDQPGYTTNVTEKHLQMKLKKEHFDKWLLLFEQTVNEYFDGPKAKLASERAKIIAWTILSKIEN